MKFYLTVLNNLFTVVLMNVNEILNISNLVFGENYLIESDIHNYLDREDAEVFVIENKTRIIGFSITQIVATARSNEVLFVPMPKQFLGYDRFGYRKMTAVHPDFRSLGIGQQLFEIGQNWFQRKKAPVVLTASWINASTLKFRKYIESVGFTAIQKMNNYWAQDSLNKNYSCKACGAPPCSCNAMLYALIKS